MNDVTQSVVAMEEEDKRRGESHLEKRARNVWEAKGKEGRGAGLQKVGR